MKHISLIMDGNRRFGKKKGISETQAYENGAKNFLKLAAFLSEEEKIPYISCWALAKENTAKRDLGSLEASFDHGKFLEEIIDSFSCEFIGDIAGLPKNIQNKVADFKEKNSRIKAFKNQAKIFIFINYSGSFDLEETIKSCNSEPVKNLQDFLQRSYVKNVPPIDAVIRTGGHNRLSNYAFLLMFYSEIYFVKKLWNEFSKKDLKKILEHYKHIRTCAYGA